MRIVFFYHSLVSDWNHGNAHFLRGVASELLARGHEVVVYEPADGWSRRHLVAEHGEAPLRDFAAAYPGLTSCLYDPATLDLAAALEEAELVLVHEWNEPELVARVAATRAGRDFVLLFHDTHHRLVTDPAAMQRFNLTGYDGVLAYGEVLREMYISRAGVPRAWTWHEAADVRRFFPVRSNRIAGDLVWIGNWGDDERAEELREFLIEPVRALGLKARVYGVRYPESALAELAAAGIEYAGWLPNYAVPEIFGQFRVTVHVPRRPYVAALPGIPTIRVFEALACGIPLVSAPWEDRENLFTPGKDFLVAADGAAMERQLALLVSAPVRRAALRAHGLATIRARHTCAHRVDELLAIHDQVRAARPRQEHAALDGRGGQPGTAPTTH